MVHGTALVVSLGRADVRPQGRVVHRATDAKRSAPGLAPHRQLQTGHRGVQMRTPAACRSTRVRRHRGGGVVAHRDDPDQLGLGRPLSASDTGTHRFRACQGIGRSRIRTTHCLESSGSAPITSPRPAIGGYRAIPVRPRRGRRTGCRSASPSGGPRAERSGLPCRWPGTAGSRGRRPEPTSPPRRRSPRC
jgi:hypothetical protein